MKYLLIILNIKYAVNFVKVAQPSWRDRPLTNEKSKSLISIDTSNESILKFSIAWLKIKSSTLTNAFVHTINRDSNERYIISITDDALEVYDIDGTQKNVVDAVGSFGTYIDNSNPKDNSFSFTVNTALPCISSSMSCMLSLSSGP